MDNVAVWQDDKLVALGFQFHYVRNFVPTKACKSQVEFGDISSKNEIGFKVGLPIYLCGHRRKLRSEKAVEFVVPDHMQLNNIPCKEWWQISTL